MNVFIKRFMMLVATLFASIAGCMAAYETYDYSEEIDGVTFYFNLNKDDRTLILKKVAPDTIKSLSIPETTTNGFKVGSIEGAFKDWKNLESVKIPNSVTTIGYEAFTGCMNLASIVIPKNVTTIGKRSFTNCTSLTSIEIPESVTTIGDYAFGDCKSLTSIEIPNSVTAIGDEAFYGCTSLASIEIPNNVTTIGYSAFADCTSLASVEIGISVTTIGEEAFSGCTSLTSAIDIPSSVTSLKYMAFDASIVPSIKFHSKTPCKCIVRSKDQEDIFGNPDLFFIIYVPKGCKESYKKYSYNGCYPFKNYYIEEYEYDYSEVIDDVTFYFDLNMEDRTFILKKITPDTIKSLSIPEITAQGLKVSSIEVAFKSYKYLESIKIPNSVTTISKNAFDSCTCLVSVEIGNGVTTTTIGSSAFSGCTSLASIEIPNSVTSIDGSAFYGCTSLASIVIPESVTTIGDKAFCGCTSLASIVIPESVTSIGKGAFTGCTSLTSIEIPISVIKIGYMAFNAKDITSIKFHSKTPPLGYANDIFGANDLLFTIYVPKGCKEIYKNYSCKKDGKTYYPYMSYNIEEYDNEDDGISTISSEAYSGKFDVFNAQGVKVLSSENKEEINTLPAGVYIVKSDEKTEKVIVK